MIKLNVVGTPIGNLEDISVRALRTLKESEVIFSEDKRVAMKLINHFELGKKELFTFNETNGNRMTDTALEIIKSGKNCVLISDAGMPVLSDPGAPLIERCNKEKIEVDVIPGPTSPITALAASGFPGSKFMFHGFIPRDKNRRRWLRSITDLKFIHIFFESPNRIIKTFTDIETIIGNVDIFVAREMTKIHQEYFRGTVKEAKEYYEKKDSVKGEFTVIMSIKDEEGKE